MVKIAILGCGVVGSGTAQILYEKREEIASRIGEEVEISYILDRRDPGDHPLADRWVRDFEPILRDPEVQIVVEALGGLEPAYTFVKESLLAGKHAVTSNKELVAAKGAELLSIAREKGVCFLFEASVGGGIPVLRPLGECLGANRIERIAGILNGTTNYILTQMIENGASFGDALAEAQRLGYAERDPTADVEGLDACRKICILASIAFGKHIYPDAVHTCGISAITPEDVQYAGAMNCSIKLLGQARPAPDGRTEVQVGPAFVPARCQLSGISDVFNGVLIHGDAVGDLVFYGPGAGKLPTASAMVTDVLNLIRAKGALQPVTWEDSDGSNLAPFESYETASYVRVLGGPEAKALIEELLCPAEYLTREGQPENELAFVTGRTTQGALMQALETLEHRGIRVLAQISLMDCD